MRQSIIVVVNLPRAIGGHSACIGQTLTPRSLHSKIQEIETTAGAEWGETSKDKQEEYGVESRNFVWLRLAVVEIDI